MAAGRHRNFDKDIALDNAMQVFWANGYPGTSLTDLTTAMGINKPSLYSAFGNKEQLFKNALDHYVTQYGAIHAKHLFTAEQTLTERVQSYLISIATMQTDPTLPRGCFVCNSTSELGGDCLPAAVSQSITTINNLTITTLVDFFTAEQAQGNLSSELSASVMANYLVTVQFGLAVMASNGAGFDELKEIIKHSIATI